MKKFIVFTLPVLLPAVVFAQQDAFDLLGIIQSIFNTLIPVLIALATVIVIWKAIMFATSDGEDKVHNKEGMIKAIIALFILVSIWGLVSILNATFGIGQGSGPSNIQNFGCYDPGNQTYSAANC